LSRLDPFQKTDSLFILIRERWKIDLGPRQIHSLSTRKHSSVYGSNSKLVPFDGDDLEGDDSIVDVDELSGGRDFDDVGLKMKERKCDASNERERSASRENGRRGNQTTGETHVIDVNNILGSLLSVSRIGRDVELVASFDRNVLSSCQTSRSDPWSFLSGEREMEVVSETEEKGKVRTPALTVSRARDKGLS